MTSVTDALGNVTRYVFDEANRLSRTIHPDGSVEILQSVNTVQLAKLTIVDTDGMKRLGNQEYPCALGPLDSLRSQSLGQCRADRSSRGRRWTGLSFHDRRQRRVTSLTEPVVGNEDLPWTTGKTTYWSKVDDGPYEIQVVKHLTPMACSLKQSITTIARTISVWRGSSIPIALPFLSSGSTTIHIIPMCPRNILIVKAATHSTKSMMKPV